MRGLIDLHCHPVPGIDDGVRSADDGAALLAGLARIGFERVVATPHVRSGYWENNPATVAPARAELEAAMGRLRAAGTVLPAFDTAGEHLIDDVVWEQFQKGTAMLYPGRRAALVELPYEIIPIRIELKFWRLGKMGVVPVLAHPERYTPLHKSSERLEEMVGAGAWPMLDVMSLVGSYGRHAQAAAERMLREGAYAAACTDAHKPSDVEPVAEGLKLLQRSVGDEEFRRLFIVGPRELLGERDG